MRNPFIISLILTKNWLRSRSGVFFSLLFPLMLLLIFGTVFGGQQTATYRLHVQNLDMEDGKPTWLSTTLIEVLENTGVFDVENMAPETDILKHVREHPSFTSYRILVIPENFEQKASDRTLYVTAGVSLKTIEYSMASLENLPENEIEAIENQIGFENLIGTIEGGRKSLEMFRENLRSESAEIILLIEEGDPAAPIVKGVLFSVLEEFNMRMVGAEPVVEVRENTLGERRLKSVDYYLPGYIAAFIMTNGVIGITMATSEQRRSGVIKRLAATPLRKSSWIAGNLIHQAILAFMLVLVMLAVGWLVFGFRAIPDPLSLLLILLGAVAFCSIGIVLGGVIKHVEAASAAGNAIAFPMMFLSGAFWPVEIMPSFLQSVAQVLPLYHFHQGLRQAMVYQNPAQTFVPFLVLGTLTLVFLYLAVKVTKWREF